MIKKRLDLLVFEKGLTPSRAQATMLIKKSGVLCDGKRLHKPGTLVSTQSQISLAGQELYVSRGAYKLLKALEYFQLNPSGKICADIGASTGGFTQVLLNRGAKKVYAIDVGHGQLVTKLRSHPLVINKEGVNAKLTISLPESIEFVVCDVSHISVTKVFPQIIKTLSPQACGILLLKPQFEAGRQRIGKKGIVNERYHSEILQEVMDKLATHPILLSKVINSPLQGKKGNHEYLVSFRSIK